MSKSSTHCLGGVVRAQMPTRFAADFACGREQMFSRPSYRADGLAPNQKRKARNMSSPTGLMTRTVVGNLRYVHQHAANSAQLIRRY